MPRRFGHRPAATLGAATAAAAVTAVLPFSAGASPATTQLGTRSGCNSACRRSGALSTSQRRVNGARSMKAKQLPSAFSRAGPSRLREPAVCRVTPAASPGSRMDDSGVRCDVRPVQPWENFFAELVKEPEKRFAEEQKIEQRRSASRRDKEGYTETECASLLESALSGDVRGVLAKLLRTRQRGVPLEAASYRALFIAILAGPPSAADDLARLGLPWEAPVSPVPPDFLLKNRPSVPTAEAWRRYDRFLDLQGLRCLLRDLGVPRDRSAAELILKICDEMRFKVRAKSRLKHTLFDNHECLQLAYAHAALGEFIDADAIIMSLWEEAPGIEEELPFHLMIREGAGGAEEGLQAAISAAILLAELEARGTSWPAEVVMKQVRSIKQAEQGYCGEEIMKEIMLAVSDIINRRDRSYTTLSSCGLSCNFSSRTMSQCSDIGNPSPIRVDHRYATRALSYFVKSLSTKTSNRIESLRWLLRNLHHVEDLRNRTAVIRTALATRQISDFLDRLGVELTLTESNQLLSALIVQRKFPDALELANAVHSRLRTSPEWQEALERTRFLQVKAALHSSHFGRSDPPANITWVTPSGKDEGKREGGCSQPANRRDWFRMTDAIRQYCAKKEPEEAEKQLEQLQSLFPGVRPPGSAIRTIWEAYARKGKTANGLRVLQLQRSWGHKLTAAEHADLMKLALGRVDQAIGTRFDPSEAELLEKLNFNNRRKWATVLAVFRLMQESGPAPNSACVAAAIEAARALEDLPRLEEVFRYARLNRIPFYRITWFSLIDLNVTACNNVGVENIMRLLQHEGSAPTPGTYLATLKLLNKSQGLSSVMEYYRYLRCNRAHKPTHSEVVQLIMMMHYGQGGDLWRFVNELKEMGYHITPEELTKNLKLCFHCQNMLAPVIVYLDVMRSFDIRLNEEAYEFLLAACSWYLCWEWPGRTGGATSSPASPRIIASECSTRHRPFFAVAKAATRDIPGAASRFISTLFREMGDSGGFARPTQTIYRYAAASLVTIRDWIGCIELLRDAHRQGRPMNEVMDHKTRNLLIDAANLAKRAGLTDAEECAAINFTDSRSFRPTPCPAPVPPKQDRLST